MTKMIQSDENAPLISQKSAGPEKVHKGWGYRHVLAFLAFFGFFNVYCMRVNLSVAMVDMVKHINDSNNSTSDECPDSNTVNSTKEHVGEFGWSRDLQGYVLGSFFYGYILTQIPGGYLAEKFGAKFLFGFGVLCTAVFTLLTPLAARWNVGVFIAVRVLEGLGEGVTFPAMHAMWGKWGPLYERSKLTGFSYTGAQMGTVISMPISAYLCDSGFLGGWPSVFYVFGALACVWFILWMMMAYNTPADHPHISVEEREYIESSVGRKEDLATPWGPILRCPAVWAINVAHFANNWGFYTMLTSLPGYMKNVLKFDLKTNALLSALPYLGCWLGQNCSSFTADYLRSNHYLSTQATRRLLTVFGLAVPGILMICIQFAGCNHTVIVALLVLCLTAGGFTMGGFQVNHIDLSPNFAGVLMGMSNTWATIPGFLGPEVVGWLTTKHDTRQQWQIVFYIAAAVYISGAIIYCIFARGTEQPWNNLEQSQGVSFKRAVDTEVSVNRNRGTDREKRLVTVSYD
ncbi:sialin-like [Mya arenaria]|uniref:sialin-like n=1 Tax=Mya arenaria TaxID=6604 RepID=UPI0022E22B47|nr:sialin-like [Mya arenaria]